MERHAPDISRGPAYWLETLGCPKNEVDSAKLTGLLHSEGYCRASQPERADLIVINTCAFIEAARQESIDTILDLAERRRDGARLVATGCMAERYGAELAEAIPELDVVAGFGMPFLAQGSEAGQVHVSTPVALGKARRGAATASTMAFDLLSLPRPASKAPWAYVKVAEGCDRSCGFCAIPSFRGKQRSRSHGEVVAEVVALRDHEGGPPLREIVLVAQDLASFGRDRTGRRTTTIQRPAPIISLVRTIASVVERVRLLYLYPSSLTDELIEVIISTGVPYFDLSLQHVSRQLLVAMRRYGDGDRFMSRIDKIRSLEPEATFRSSFIVGYPGETEADHDRLLSFLREARLDWAGFFPFSPEDGTPAVELPDQVPTALKAERLRECTDVQDEITQQRRDRLIGRTLPVLVDSVGVARSVHEAPQIDGIIEVPGSLVPGALLDVVVTAATGPDLVAQPVGAPARQP